MSRCGGRFACRRQRLRGSALLRDFNSDGNMGSGNLGKDGSGLDQRIYPMQDANWNVTGLYGFVPGSGIIVRERYVYDPYGQVTVLKADWTAGPATPSQAWYYLHRARRWDAAAGLYHFRNRDYSPTLGRWMTEDPLGYVDRGSLYQYVKSSPMTGVDPAGTNRVTGYFSDAHWFLAIDSWNCNESTGAWEKGRPVEYNFSIDWEEANRQPLTYLLGTVGIFIGAPARLSRTTSDRLPDGDLIESTPAQDYVAHLVITPYVNYPAPYNGTPDRYNILLANCRQWSSVFSNAGMRARDSSCDCRVFLDELNSIAPAKAS